MAAEPMTLPIVIDADWLCVLGVNLSDQVDEFKDSIQFGSKEQWIAWEFLRSAADKIYSAGVYLDAHNLKQEGH